MPPARSLIIVMRTDSCNSLSPAATQALISPARPGPAHVAVGQWVTHRIG